MGKVIPFVIRYKDLEEQPTYDLFKDIALEIVRQKVIDSYNNGIMSGLMDSSMDFREYYSITTGDINADELILIGLDLIYLMASNSNLINMSEIKVDANLSRRIITQKPGFVALLDRVSYIDSIELPMLIRPIPWEIDSSVNISNYGGTIFNSKYKFRSLRSHSF